MSSHPPRDELADRHTWDLTRVYDSPADWERAHDDLRDRLADLRSRSVDTTGPDSVASALSAVADALVTTTRLELYAQLRRDEDPTDADRIDRKRRAQSLAAEVREAVNAVRERLQRDADAVHEVRDDPVLDGWRPYLDDVLDRAPHTRDPAVESALANFEPVVEAQTDTVVAIETGDFDPPTVEGPDGDPFQVDKQGFADATSHADRAFRRRAHDAYFSALGDHEHALAAAVAADARAQSGLAETRNYDSVRAMALSMPSYPETGVHVTFPGSAHDALTEQVYDHADAYYRLQERRRERLGVEQLRPWDLNAPLVDGDPPHVELDDLREALLSAVDPLGAGYRDRLADFFDERRIDVYPAADKRSDIPAYCPSSPETGAFVLANFRENVRTAFYLAHELGHAMHVEELRAAQPPRYVTNPRPVSEVPSILHELLLADHLADDPELAPFVRERRATLLSGNVFGAGQSARFLHEVYRTVENGDDLTPDRMASLYGEFAHGADPRSPVGAPDLERGWRRQAYQRGPCHSYQYVVGAVGAVAVHDRLRSGSLSPDEYREFLRTTGRRDSLDTLATLGVDPTASTPYDRLADDLAALGEKRTTQ